jgi:hypothetical protein
VRLGVGAWTFILMRARLTATPRNSTKFEDTPSLDTVPQRPRRLVFAAKHRHDRRWLAQEGEAVARQLGAKIGAVLDQLTGALFSKDVADDLSH